MDPHDNGEVFFEDLLRDEEMETAEEDEEEQSANSADEFFDNDESMFSMQTVESSDSRDIYGNPMGEEEETEESVEDDGEHGHESEAAEE